MNGINIKAILTVIIGLLGGLYVLVEVLTARTGIGQLYLYLAVMALMTGLVAPKKALYVMAFCTIYIDFFKRLMIIGGMPSFIEVSYVLAIPPLLVGGSLVSVVASLAFSREKIARDLVIAFIVASIVAVGSVAGTLATSVSGLGGVGNMINQGFYAYLVFLVPIIFPSDEERRKYLLCFFWMMLPSVAYMFFQEYNGYTSFEYDYLNSGLSIEAKNLAESMAGEMRKFSTFNGCGTASTLYSVFIIYCFVSLRKDNQPPTPMQRWGKILLAPLFMMAAYYTISRTGWFSGIATLAAYVMLGSRFRSYLGIFSAIGSFLVVVALAPIAIKQNWLSYLESQLQYTVMQFTDDPSVKRAVVLGTLGDRLQGWTNLTQESRLYTPFGFAAAGINYGQTTNNDFRWGHDAIIDSLIKFGYIPVFFGLCMGMYLTYMLLRYMYSLPKKSITFKITRLCLALNAGILAGGLSSSSQFRNYPQNFFFMLWIAVPFATYQQAMRERRKNKGESMDAIPTDFPALATARTAAQSGA